MRKSLLVVLALLLFSPVPANSREITEGTANVPPSFAFVVILMNVSGTDFTASVAGSNLFQNAFASCTVSNPCSPGQVFNIRTFSGQWDFSNVSGSMTIDGTQYVFVNATPGSSTLPAVSGGGSLGFVSRSVMIPFTDAPTITLKAPFTMSGSLSGSARGILGVGLSLSGSGIATMVLRPLLGPSGPPQYVFSSLTYRFGPQAGVDIQPSRINLRSRGKVPVAILSTENFDASTIDPGTVTVAGAPVDVKPQGTRASSLQDINGDGLLDLVVHINTAEVQLTDFNTEALVEGLTFGGKFFWGTDVIEVVE